jgi:hypothetical protein
MSGTQQDGSEQDLLRDVGETGGVARTEGQGGGGTEADESFTMGGPRGRDAERGEYYEASEDDEDETTGDAGR